MTRCKLNSLGVGYSCVWMSFSLCLHVSTDSTVAVAMYYPWQASVNIYYTIQSVNNLWLVKLFWFIIFLCLLSYYSRRLEIISLSLSLSLSPQPWPLSEASTALHTTISYDGPYSFVHDIHCNLNEPITSYYRSVLEKLFLRLLKFSPLKALFLHKTLCCLCWVL